MAGWLAPLIAGVVGVSFGIGSSLMLVNTQTAAPAPVEAPFVVYGTQ